MYSLPAVGGRIVRCHLFQRNHSGFIRRELRRLVAQAARIAIARLETNNDLIPEKLEQLDFRYLPR